MGKKFTKEDVEELYQAIWLLLNYLDENCEDMYGYYETTGLLQELSDTIELVRRGKLAASKEV